MSDDTATPSDAVAEIRKRKFADELRKWWSFDHGQHHTHTWHGREDFIANKLPALLADLISAQQAECERLRTKLAKAREALRPFAETAKDIEDNPDVFGVLPDRADAPATFGMAQLRAALKAMEETDG